jgi:DNA-nicking Smr family endonuclease
MPGKSRDPEAEALWQRVAETVRPLKGRTAIKRAAVAGVPIATAPITGTALRIPKPIAKRAVSPGETLDGGWDRRLRRGVVSPDMAIDLHGHTLVAAHAALEGSLARAVAMQFRLLLIVTGRAPRPDTERRDGRPVRGAIRASIDDWLHMSRFAAHVAAVRNAHPRHGGAGALYVVLRRTRE